MEREIKFRGYNSVKGWMYGYFTIFEQYPKIWQDNTPYDVQIESIGQFTGLKDKNGKDIYEGDIILNPEATEPEEKGFIVKFIGFKWLGVNVNYPNNHYYSIDFSSIISEKYEVVGNIHQPELIK